MFMNGSITPGMIAVTDAYTSGVISEGLTDIDGNTVTDIDGNAITDIDD